MRRLLRIYPLLLVLMTLPCVAVRSYAATKTTAAAHAPAVSDAQIDATIRTKLAKSKIGKDGFKYHVQHGLVTWEGTTNVIQHKGSATRMAHAAGATQVQNNIQISASAKAKAVSNLKRAQVVH